jgi:hypothetical protein
LRIIAAAIAEIQVLAHVELEDLGRLLALLEPDLGRAPTHVTGRHVDDAGAVPEVVHLSQHRTGADLSVVGVGPEGEKIHRHVVVSWVGTRAQRAVTR